MKKFIYDVCHQSRIKIVDRLSTGVAWIVLTGLPAIAVLFPIPSLVALVSALVAVLAWRVIHRHRNVKRFLVLAGTHSQKENGKYRTYSAGEIVESEKDLMAVFVNKFAPV